MTVLAGIAYLAPAASNSAIFHLSTTTIVIIVVAIVIGVVGIIGWRAPDRSPHADEKAERDRDDR
jgi:hypothetical protein